MWRYRLSHWAFRWVSDESGDVGLELFGIVTFLKYKDSTIIYWFRHFENAGKWQGYETKEDKAFYANSSRRNERTGQ